MLTQTVVAGYRHRFTLCSHTLPTITAVGAHHSLALDVLSALADALRALVTRNCDCGLRASGLRSN